MNPKFTIIVPHYQGVIPHETFLEGIESLQSQTFQDFEILCYHDGPLLDTSVKFPIPIKCTDKRYNDWGHSLRDMGIQEAKGEYIIHLNPDNILYLNALEELQKNNDPLQVFSVKMIGMEESNGVRFYSTPRDISKSVTITGNPAVYGNIDCMQLVMKTLLWRSEEGWKDKREQSDGIMYPYFANKYNVKYISKILGEHR
tara:strand:- start:3116 stop:3715 length:600 start_codon:yes stop_codon:yes gene_type:complete